MTAIELTAEGHGHTLPGTLTARGNRADITLEIDEITQSESTLRIRAHGELDRRPLRVLPLPLLIAAGVSVPIMLALRPPLEDREYVVFALQVGAGAVLVVIAGIWVAFLAIGLANVVIVVLIALFWATVALLLVALVIGLLIGLVTG